MMEQSRDDALNRMAQHAKQLGANAVISTAFDSNEISQYMQEILAYGTAVLIDTADNHTMMETPEEKLDIL